MEGFWVVTGMTKKVISIIVLFVALLVGTSFVYADYAGLSGDVFDIKFKWTVDDYVEVNIRNIDNNADLDLVDVIQYDDSSALQNPQCQIVVSTNFQPEIKVTYNLFKCVDNDSNTSTFGYIVRLTDDGSTLSYKGVNYDNLEVSKDGVTALFLAGDNDNYGEYKYPMAFKFDFEGADSGTYQATITVEVTTT